MNPELTPREEQILELLSQGMTNRAIAEALGLKASTVKSHVSSILRKVGAPSRIRRR
jgi:two-component system, NarL family, nitrate/nitrite response regulator NarL